VLPRLITKLVGWAVAVFYDVERTGPRLASGPVLVTANHPNALIDPLVIFRTAGRPTRPLAKAPLFEQLLVGTVLKGLGGLPVYRRQDDPALMHLNDRTFDAAISALQAGGAVQIYPEGQSHSEPSMTPIRTGAARIALLAESQAGWELGLHVQPVGLTYERKHAFRGKAIAAFGDPIEIGQLRELYERDEREAVRQLTDSIRRGLEEQTVSFRNEQDQELVSVAERLYAREKGISRPRERDSMATRLPRLQRFSEGIAWLQDTDPDRLEHLRQGVSRYLRLLTVFGATEGDVPRTYRPPEVLAYGVRQLAMLTLVLPAALVGALCWMVPYIFTRGVSARCSVELDQIATYKLAAGFFSFATWLVLVSAGLWFTFGMRAAVVGALLLPVLGLATVAWRDRQGVVREDVRVFLRAQRRSQARDRLAEQRSDLVAEFDALAHLQASQVDG
jgi:glycerol-3-phosphate O-acyltransferase/dihydroxyacetone phosphate acyltransferase